MTASDDDSLLLPPSTPLEVDEPAGPTSNQSTAKRALAILLQRPGFLVPTGSEKRNISEAFASRNQPVYGQAFDALHASTPVNLGDVSDIKRDLAEITLYEVKATDRTSAKEDFSRHFFSMSTAELLVAQKLGDQFRFAFVDVNRGTVLDLSLREIYSRAKAIYPTWSIRF